MYIFDENLRDELLNSLDTELEKAGLSLTKGQRLRLRLRWLESLRAEQAADLDLALYFHELVLAEAHTFDLANLRAGQLHFKAGNHKMASAFYAKASSHTESLTDPENGAVVCRF